MVRKAFETEYWLKILIYLLLINNSKFSTGEDLLYMLIKWYKQISV